MNREQRRSSGISKEANKKLEQLKSNCTVMEAIQLAQGVSEDAITNYHNTINPIIVSLSIQIEVLKDMLFEKHSKEGDYSVTYLLSEEEFVTKFNEKLGDYNKQKDEAFKKIEESLKESQVSKEGPDNLVSDIKTDVIPMPLQVEVTKKN